ncbi:MAG: nuclear transport factor 2 family protein [Pyrinomonadaceae bacterium]
MKPVAILFLSVCVLSTACSRSAANNAAGSHRTGGNSDVGGDQTAAQAPANTPTPAPTPDPLAAIQKLTADLGTALAQGNADQLDAILSDGYLHINDNGQLVTKPDITSGVRSGTVKFDSVNIQEVNIRVYGDAAVVNAIFMGTNAANGGSSNVQDRVTLVADREGDNWRFVSGQTTPTHPVAQSGNTKSGAAGGMGQGGNSGIMGSGGTGTGTGTGAGGGSQQSGPGGSQGTQGGSGGTSGGTTGGPGGR